MHSQFHRLNSSFAKFQEDKVAGPEDSVAGPNAEVFPTGLKIAHRTRGQGSRGDFRAHQIL